MSLNVNTDGIVKFTKKLEEIHRSALPIAIRSTLNETAFETKKNVPIETASNFTTRNKSFFRSLTIVEKAGGFDIDKMESKVGINAKNKSSIAENLEKQEHGGTIGNRGLIAMDKARSSGSKNKKVSAQNYLSKINIKKGKGLSFVMIKKGTKGTVFKVKKGGGKNNLIPLYSFSRGRKATVKPSPFMAPASFKARKLMPYIYIEQAEKQFKKYLK